MKSEIDVEAELEKQRRVHYAVEKEKLMKSIPGVMRNIKTFLAYCYAVTTPLSKRQGDTPDYNPQFSLDDMKDMALPTGLSFDMSKSTRWSDL